MNWISCALRRAQLRTTELTNALVDRTRALISTFYYRFIFARGTSLDKKLKMLVYSWERQSGKGDIPVCKQVWDRQYATGQWDGLNELDELAHYSVVVGYIQHLKPKASILDVGCGKGILRERLAPYGYSRYVGIDISDEAIQQWPAIVDGKTSLVAGDATQYSPAETFDVIVFNEVLYYFHDPLEVLARYRRYLKQDGILIISIYVTERGAAIERRLHALYPSLDRVSVTDKSKTWICSVFAPDQHTNQ